MKKTENPLMPKQIGITKKIKKDDQLFVPKKIIKNAEPLMPKGTALWLKIHTELSMEQIAEFCHMTINQVELISERDCIAYNPISIKQLTQEVISRCEKNPNERLVLTCSVPQNSPRGRYISPQQKINMPGYLKWFHERGVSTEKIAKMLKMRHSTIEKGTQSVINTNVKEIYPQGLLTTQELDEILK